MQLELRVSDPFIFAERSDASSVRGIADGFARQGVSLTVVAPARPLVTLGVPRTSWQRRLTGSRHIRVERDAGLWSLVRGRAQAPSGASRLDIGDWTLTYYREEYPDHGRPYGGPIGGELGHQRRQPARSLRPPHPEEHQ